MKGSNEGASTGAVEKSPARRKRDAARRRRQEQRWSQLAGPVTVRQVENVDQEASDD